MYGFIDCHQQVSKPVVGQIFVQYMVQLTLETATKSFELARNKVCISLGFPELLHNIYLHLILVYGEPHSCQRHCNYNYTYGKDLLYPAEEERFLCLLDNGK